MRRRRRRVRLRLVTTQQTAGEARPLVRSDCQGGVRPCPWVGCRHHLFLEVDAAGALHVPVGTQPWQLEHSCALDLAREGGLSAQEVGDALRLSHTAVLQIERRALAKAMRDPVFAELVAARRVHPLALVSRIWQAREREDRNGPELAHAL